MRNRLIAAAVTTFSLFLMVVFGLVGHTTLITAAPGVGCPMADEVDCPAIGGAAKERLAFDAGANCPMLDATECPASKGAALAHLALAAAEGCPFSTEQLIKNAQHCTDDATAALARKAEAGDDDATAELIRRVRALNKIDPVPVERGLEV